MAKNWRKGDVLRRVRALELRLSGLTQAQAAAEVGVSERMCRRYESDLRRGHSPSLGKISRVLTEAHKSMQDQRARAAILGALANVACEAAREAAEAAKLDQLRASGKRLEEDKTNAEVPKTCYGETLKVHDDDHAERLGELWERLKEVIE